MEKTLITNNEASYIRVGPIMYCAWCEKDLIIGIITYYVKEIQACKCGKDIRIKLLENTYDDNVYVLTVPSLCTTVWIKGNIWISIFIKL